MWKIREICENILSLDWSTIAAYGSNMLTNCRGTRRAKRTKKSNQKIECPLHASDGARVISGIIDQISAMQIRWVFITIAD